MSVAEVLAAVRADLVFFHHSGGGLALSGGEPLLQPRFAAGLLAAARAASQHGDPETCPGGAIGQSLATVLPQCDRSIAT